MHLFIYSFIISHSFPYVLCPMYLLIQNGERQAPALEELTVDQDDYRTKIL